MPSFRHVVNLDVGIAVCGVAQLHGRIFVVCLESPVIRVFSDSPPYSRLTDITVQSMDDPNDIAACPASGRLYIADWGYHCVWKVDDVTYRSPRAQKWITSLSPWAVSVGPTSRVLVTPRLVVCGDRSIDRNMRCLSLFDVDCRVIATVPLPDGLSVEHSVETRRSTFIICHARDPSVEQPCGDNEVKAAISELDLNGVVIRSFRSFVGDGLLDWPRHLGLFCATGASTIDVDEPPSGHCFSQLFVSDFKSGRVLLFDNHLERFVVVLSDGDICKPRRLSYQSADGHLVVGLFSGVVGIYKHVGDAGSADQPSS